MVAEWSQKHPTKSSWPINAVCAFCFLLQERWHLWQLIMLPLIHLPERRLRFAEYTCCFHTRWCILSSISVFVAFVVHSAEKKARRFVNETVAFGRLVTPSITSAKIIAIWKGHPNTNELLFFVLGDGTHSVRFHDDNSCPISYWIRLENMPHIWYFHIILSYLALVVFLF